MDELPTFPDNISNDNRTFLTKCFQRDPNDRGDVSSLLLHPFLINNLSQSQRTASRNKMQSKSRYSHLPSRGGGHHDNNHISEISVRPTTSAGERLWTAGAGAQRWEKEKQREKVPPPSTSRSEIGMFPLLPICRVCFVMPPPSTSRS